MLDPHTFNTTLAAVGRAMSEPVSAELAAAYERIGELEAALRPFAELADVCDHFGHDDERRLCHVKIDGKRHEGVSVGDLRRARTALNDEVQS